MRILIISGSLPPMKCGVGDYTAHLANALTRQVNTTVAVLTDVSASPKPPNFEFEVFPISDGWRMSDIGRIALAVWRWKPDLMHIQYPTQGYGQRYFPWFLPVLFRIAGVPVVQTWHGYDSRRMTRRLLPNSVLAGGLIVVRPEYMDMMAPLYRWLNRRKYVKFIPNASTIPPIQLSEDERSAVRSRFCSPDSRLIAFFGFVYPDRGTELLFQVADPGQHHLVFISDLNSADEYQKSILDQAQRDPWAGSITITGYLPAEEVGQILAAADAVVLPFKDGGGMWNTSIRAAISQGSFVLTTAREQHGYDSTDNTYYARPDDIADMRNALRTYLGKRNSISRVGLRRDWDSIAQAHLALYETVAPSRIRNPPVGLVVEK
jgi:glycosyltransferase involved in cell wall biosynthesis